jgi:hypothetical protein
MGFLYGGDRPFHIASSDSRTPVQTRRDGGAGEEGSRLIFSLQYRRPNDQIAPSFRIPERSITPSHDQRTNQEIHVAQHSALRPIDHFGGG